MSQSTVYLSTEQVILINTMLIKLYSPKEPIGVKEPTLLDSAINRPKQSIFGEDAYPSIHEKAAALFESIAKNHAFHNANKRTALASLIVFLKLNNYGWLMNAEDEQDFVVDVVNQKYDFKEMVEIIQKNTIVKENL